ncbi:cysteine desulfurase family protein [Deinococcus humi]|uniref:Cysteine desulfurase n=1 Tax=Deinococcus humi TaxID=662880 RepID=A0A7W8JYU1_9DEIO|nr:cysteine desulfurase family protein [Deinococcus humi]MBB5365720.1 cysteine desulfurase [Deinococcus humi]GGO38463.1 cysteine desulfurase IscS [Deinococcus humi]
MTRREFIYLDYNATTPCDPRVLEVMLPHFTEHFANPSSSTHPAGRRAADALEEAREQVAGLFGASARDVIFTSGATESNNLALYGVARAALREGDRRQRIVTLPTEHKAVLEPVADLAVLGFDVQYAPVHRDGQVDLAALVELVDTNTLLVSIQAANSEVGTLQPLAEIGALTRAVGAYFHTDATQAVGRVALDWRSLPADLLSLSSHKIYGPKGAGALLARRALRQGKLDPLTRGGGQEGKLRAGTQNVPALVGFGLACELMAGEGLAEAERQRGLRDEFERRLSEALPQVSFNGRGAERLPNTSSVTVPGVEADALLMHLPNLGLSLGSACNSGALEPSYVLTELGLSGEIASSTFRMSLGKNTSREDVQRAVTDIAQGFETLHLAEAGSPL